MDYAQDMRWNPAQDKRTIERAIGQKLTELRAQYWKDCTLERLRDSL